MSLDKGLNELLSNAFVATIKRLPDSEFACTEAPLAGVTVTPTVYYGGIGLKKAPGNVMEFDPVTLTFILDEELNGYLEIMRWLKEYQSSNNPEELVSDISVVLTHGDNGEHKVISYHDAFPVSVDEITFASSTGAPTVQTVRVTFEINNISFDTV